MPAPFELGELLAEAWLATVPKRLVREHEQGLIERLRGRVGRRAADPR